MRIWEISLLVIGILGLGWVFWVYVLEAKRCYEEDMAAQKRTLEAEANKQKLPKN